MEVGALVVVVLLTLGLQHWLQQHIQGFTYAVTGNPGCAVRVLFFLLLPGVLLHEFSHWLVANLLGVRTGTVSVGLGKKRGKHMSLGSVVVERSDPLRESLIGVAPFVFGTITVAAILGFGFDLWPNSPLSVEIVANRIWSTIGDPLTWAALYLVFAVSTAMVPSQSDREPWAFILVVFAVIVVSALVFGWTPNFSDDVIGGARQAVEALVLVFSLIAIVNGTLAVTIWFTEWAFGRVTQRRVRY